MEWGGGCKRGQNMQLQLSSQLPQTTPLSPPVPSPAVPPPSPPLPHKADF